MRKLLTQLSALLIVVLCVSRTNAQTMSCQNNVQVSLGSNCESIISPQMILTGAISSPTSYSVMVGNTGANLVNASNLNTTIQVKVIQIGSGNSCWGTIKVEDKSAPVIDCSTPVVSSICADPNLSISLNPKIAFNNNPANGANVNTPVFGQPTVTENCNTYTLTYSDMVTDYDCATTIINGLSAQIMRKFTAVDAQGNQSMCTITINLTKPNISTVVFPSNKDIACDATYAKDANGNPAISVAGSPTVNGVNIYPTMAGYCEFNATYQDSIYASCGNLTKIRRAWTVLDWCTNTFVKKYQIIEFTDKKAPEFVNCAAITSFNLITSASACALVNYTIAKPAVTDNCDANPTVTAKILSTSGQTISNGLTITSLPIGDYVIRFLVSDACGNSNFCDKALTVRDIQPPVAVCRTNTKVALTLDGTGKMNAVDVNEGSNDNCCLDASRFEIKRNGDNDSTYAKVMKFTCADNNLMVTLRAWDCNNNSNTCMVNVLVEDKIAPVIFAQDTMLICSNNADAKAWMNSRQPQLKTLATYPSATNPGYFDNCGVSTAFVDKENINNCGVGTYTRTWTATDNSGKTSITTQTIMSMNMSAYEVKFPEDKVLTCNATQNYNTDPSTTGTPEITTKGGSCPLVGVEHSDLIFDVVPGACFKILRTWKVLNWCQPTAVNADADRGTQCSTDHIFSNVDAQTVAISILTDVNNPLYKFKAAAVKMVGSVCNGYDDDGYMEFTQVIKVIDNVPPVITVQPTISIVAKGKGCESTVIVTAPTATDCTNVIESSVSVYAKAPNGTEKFVDSYTFTNANDSKSWDFDLIKSSGKYVARFKVSDKCGNYSTKDIDFVIKDVKKPTPVCHNILSIELMASGMVMMNAKLLDAGSYDNCTPQSKLKYRIQSPAPIPGTSFDPALADSMYTFTCPPPTTIPNGTFAINYSVALWVGDEDGNWDFCSTYVNVQDNMQACKYTPIQMKTITGTIATQIGTAMPNVKVKLAGVKNMETTTDANGVYTFKDMPLNETYNIQPELNTFPLNGVSTYDLVLVSKKILNTEPFNSPYKFFAADANNNKSVSTADLVELRKLILHINDQFSNGQASWTFVDKNIDLGSNPLSKSINNPYTLDNNSGALDFVAVKIGDVSGNAASNPIKDRSNGSVTFQTDEQIFTKGQVLTIPISTTEFANIEGYQFTLKYDTNVFYFVNLEGAKENYNVLQNGTILISWYGTALANGQICNLILKAKQNAKLSQYLDINNNEIDAEVYTSNSEIKDIKLAFKGVDNTAAFELYQNEPNPFTNTTTIRFSLPVNENATISILDATGRNIKTMNQNFEKGINEIKINRQELPTSGIFYYRLSTSKHTATKKMINMY